MDLTDVTLPAALLAGLLSFLSPCVLPLVPAYVAYMMGGGGTAVAVTTGGAAAMTATRTGMLASGVAFVAGLSAVFITFFYVLRTVLLPVRPVLSIVSGIVVIVLALQVGGVLRLPVLMRELRFVGAVPRRGGPLGGLLLGVSFAFGWTPCVGAVLGAILSSAISEGTTQRGLTLMVVYCVGLGLPFVVMALVFDRAARAVRLLARYRRAIELTSAAVLLLMGVLLLTSRLTLLSSWFAGAPS